MSRWDSPTKLRRMGREAYARNVDPDERNPFTGNGQYANAWGAQFRAPQWLEGWNEAASADSGNDELGRRENNLRAVDEAKTIDDVKDILRALIEDGS